MRKLLNDVKYHALCTEREEMRIFKEDIADHLLLGKPLLFCPTKKAEKELKEDYKFFAEKYDSLNHEICEIEKLAALEEK